MNNSDIISKENKTIFITGPTSSGKTEIAHNLAKKISRAEIISADSMQVYKYMDIITSKPDMKRRWEIPYHLIDKIGFDCQYSASDFHDDAVNIIREIIADGKVPIVVGGTGLYIRTLLRGIFQTPKPNPDFRSDMENIVKQYGEETLHNLLKTRDPEAGKKIDPKNVRRVIRALEVYQFTGKKISELQKQWNKPYKDNHPVMGKLYLWGIFWPRKIMYERINNKVDQMIAQGLVGEVKNLIGLGIENNIVASQALGIKEISRYLEGKLSLPESIELLKQNTRRYAKRQITWFSKEEEFEWFVLYKDSDMSKITNLMFKKFNI